MRECKFRTKSFYLAMKLQALCTTICAKPIMNIVAQSFNQLARIYPTPSRLTMSTVAITTPTGFVGSSPCIGTGVVLVYTRGGKRSSSTYAESLRNIHNERNDHI